MKRPLLYAGIGCVISVFALAQIPASLVVGAVLPAGIQLEGCEGTLWHGRARTLGLGEMAVQQDVSWRFRAGDVLAGRLAWDFSGKYGAETSSLTLAVSSSRSPRLENVRLALPLEPLLNQSPKLKPLRIGGLLRLSTPAIDPLTPATASGRIENLFSALAPEIGSLGSSEFSITTQPDHTATWTIRPVEGALTITGNGKIDLHRESVAGKLAFKPDEKLSGTLRPVLSGLSAGSEGEYVLALSEK